eukprot:885822-Rhodomonas_salina.1
MAREATVDPIFAVERGEVEGIRRACVELSALIHHHHQHDTFTPCNQRYQTLHPLERLSADCCEVGGNASKVANTYPQGKPEALEQKRWQFNFMLLKAAALVSLFLPYENDASMLPLAAPRLSLSERRLLLFHWHANTRRCLVQASSGRPRDLTLSTSRDSDAQTKKTEGQRPRGRRKVTRRASGLVWAARPLPEGTCKSTPRVLEQGAVRGCAAG